jgi:hypothetical protein
MQGQPSPDHAISMLRQLDAAGRAGEMLLGSALASANALTHGRGQDLLNNLMRRNLITPVGGGAIRLVRLTDLGREALASGQIPAVAPVTHGPGQPDAARSPAVVSDDLSGPGRPPRAGGTGPGLADDGADRLAARMREHAVFIAAIAGVVIGLAALLEPIGVPEAQFAAAQGHVPLDLWGNAWCVTGLVVGAVGLILLLAAAALYTGKRRGQSRRGG